MLTTRPLDEQSAVLRAWARSITPTGKTIAIDYTVPGYTGSKGGDAWNLASPRTGCSTR